MTALRVEAPTVEPADGEPAVLEVRGLSKSFGSNLVLSDIMMPGGVSGLQLARQIRQQHPSLPVLLSTGYVEAAADLKDGEFDLLLKPFTLEALAQALATAVE